VCRYHSEITALMARVESEGPIIETKQGPIISPAARLLQQTRKDFSKLASSFGMTPESESRIPRPADRKPDEANPLAAFGILG
jgi:P27 family predicted phage terminase small subunit